MKYQRSGPGMNLKETRVVFYLRPALLMKLRSYAKAHEKSVSFVVADAVRALVDGKGRHRGKP